MTRDNLV
jgi:hypothetical protein